MIRKLPIIICSKESFRQIRSNRCKAITSCTPNSSNRLRSLLFSKISKRRKREMIVFQGTWLIIRRHQWTKVACSHCSWRNNSCRLLFKAIWLISRIINFRQGVLRSRRFQKWIFKLHNFRINSISSLSLLLLFQEIDHQRIYSSLNHHSYPHRTNSSKTKSTKTPTTPPNTQSESNTNSNSWTTTPQPAPKGTSTKSNRATVKTQTAGATTISWTPNSRRDSSSSTVLVLITRQWLIWEGLIVIRWFRIKVRRRGEARIMLIKRLSSRKFHIHPT